MRVFKFLECDGAGGFNVNITTNIIRLDLNTIFLVLLILKLTHNIGLSWFWVWAPVWIPCVWAVLLFAAFVCGYIESVDR